MIRDRISVSLFMLFKFLFASTVITIAPTTLEYFVASINEIGKDKESKYICWDYSLEILYYMELCYGRLSKGEIEFDSDSLICKKYGTSRYPR